MTCPCQHVKVASSESEPQSRLATARLAAMMYGLAFQLSVRCNVAWASTSSTKEALVLRVVVIVTH